MSKCFKVLFKLLIISILGLFIYFLYGYITSGLFIPSCAKIFFKKNVKYIWYRDPETGFEFKYPSNLKIDRQDQRIYTRPISANNMTCSRLLGQEMEFSINILTLDDLNRDTGLSENIEYHLAKKIETIKNPQFPEIEIKYAGDLEINQMLGSLEDNYYDPYDKNVYIFSKEDRLFLIRFDQFHYYANLKSEKKNLYDDFVRTRFNERNEKIEDEIINSINFGNNTL